MKTELRIKLAKLLWRASVKVTPRVEKTEAYKSLPEELKATNPQDAAIEASDELTTWTPKQSGNVVTVEPMLMVKHRRGEI